MKKLLVIFALVFLATNASAGILLEPYVGYVIGENDDGTDKTDLTGMGYGGRIGWQFPFVFIAFDYFAGGLEEEVGVSTVDWDTTNMAGVVGVSVAFIRAWAGMIFDAEAKQTVSGTKYTISGDGFKGGLGFSLPVPFPLYLNVEYISSKYDDVTPKVDATATFVSLSAPLTF